MDPKRFALDTPPAPADATAERRRPTDARPLMRAAPPDGADNERPGEDEDEEPGYGHGV